MHLHSTKSTLLHVPLLSSRRLKSSILIGRSIATRVWYKPTLHGQYHGLRLVCSNCAPSLLEDKYVIKGYQALYFSVFHSGLWDNLYYSDCFKCYVWNYRLQIWSKRMLSNWISTMQNFKSYFLKVNCTLLLDHQHRPFSKPRLRLWIRLQAPSTHLKPWARMRKAHTIVKTTVKAVVSKRAIIFIETLVWYPVFNPPYLIQSDARTQPWQSW